MATLAIRTSLDAIDCDGAPYPGIKLALTARLEQMCVLREAALDWSDPEGVHKMRVASRRLRCALKDFEPYLGKRSTATSLRLVKELARALGRVRDYDVSLLTLEQTAADAPKEVAEGIRLFALLQDSGRQRERANLEVILTGDSINMLKEKFAGMLKARQPRVLATRTPQDTDAAGNENAYRDVAGSIIRERLAEFEQLSNSLYQPLETKPLHDMRIAGKSLRYALQLFEPCWGPNAKFFADKVAQLQSSLGQVHDCDVWIEEFGKALSSNVGNSDCETRASLVWLIRHFVKLRAKHLARALKQWQKWETRKHSLELQNMIAETHSLTAS
jgi:CHAD domain-containing protein